MTIAPTDLVGQTLGPYRLERLLGQGGFAWVFVAREGDGTPVALKVLKPRYAASTGVNMTIGTPHYLSPEQAQGRPLDPRADFYALGVTLYKAASNEVPFTSNDWFELARMHVEEPPPSLRKKRPEISKRFERVVFKCLGKHPDDRYKNATELLEDLQEVEAKHRATVEIGVAPLGTKQQLAITG